MHNYGKGGEGKEGGEGRSRSRGKGVGDGVRDGGVTDEFGKTSVSRYLLKKCYLSSPDERCHNICFMENRKTNH